MGWRRPWTSTGCWLAQRRPGEAADRPMNSASLMLGAWVIEAVIGYPAWLHRRIKHPVVWIGALIHRLDQTLNGPGPGRGQRYALGMATTVATVALATGVGLAAASLPASPLGWLAQAAIASSLLASRSLYVHVVAVADALASEDLAGARRALAQIVGRETTELSGTAVAGAALESLSENTSDGVIAPLFWGVLLGLPGLAAYKAVNTLDSMIGHRSERHAHFGAFAARLDDGMNWLPARLTGLLLAAASCKRQAFTVMCRDANKHRSPNAGWPEGAAAGALGVRLGGPRRYGDHTVGEPWLNADARDPELSDLRRGLALYVRAAGLAGLLLAAIAVLPRLL